MHLVLVFSFDTILYGDEMCGFVNAPIVNGIKAVYPNLQIHTFLLFPICLFLPTFPP